jgi:hypothetical protein
MLHRLRCCCLFSRLGESSNSIVDIVACDEEVWSSFCDLIDETFHKSWSTLGPVPLIVMLDNFLRNQINRGLPE